MTEMRNACLIFQSKSQDLGKEATVHLFGFVVIAAYNYKQKSMQQYSFMLTEQSLSSKTSSVSSPTNIFKAGKSWNIR